MDLASAEAEIRHVFGDTLITEASIGAAPPDILVKLSGQKSVPPLMGDTAGTSRVSRSKPLSSTNISGGAARHEKVSPKTWRILAFADAIWFLSLQVFTTDQPRSRAFKKTFAPLAFAKKLWLGCFREKIKDKIGFFRS